MFYNFDFPMSPISGDEDKKEWVPETFDFDDFSMVKQENNSFMFDNNQSNYKLDLNLVNQKLFSFSPEDISDTGAGEADIEDENESPILSPLNFNATTTESKVSTKKAPKVSKRKGPRKQLTSTQKAAHNIIEKKYRININTKIESLQKLIPSMALDEAGFKTRTNGLDYPMKSNKLNKSSILDRAIEYITLLQTNQSKIASENDMLKQQLEQYTGCI